MTKHELKRILKNKTGCTIQHDGWPCGSCFGALLSELGINSDSDKAQGLWQSLLVYRGDYKLGDGLDDIDLEQATVDVNIAELKVLLEPKLNNELIQGS